MGLSVPSIILILVIVILLFGTSKLKNMGSDLGSALKGFKKAVSEEEKEEKDADFAPLDKPEAKPKNEVNDAEVTSANKSKTEDKQK